MITGLQSGDNHDTVTPADAAYRMEGYSSLGRLRYAAMLRVAEGKGSILCLVDIKEGVTAAAVRTAELSMPRDNAIRVVTGAKAISPNLGARMMATHFGEAGVFLRELMLQDLKIEVEALTPQAVLWQIIFSEWSIRAHGRQMDKPTRDARRAELPEAHSTSLEAPTWFWSNIVELVAIYEAAYLDHGRKFALAKAA